MRKYSLWLGVTDMAGICQGEKRGSYAKKELHKSSERTAQY
jgi:hypothetical protein